MEKRALKENNRDKWMWTAAEKRAANFMNKNVGGDGGETW
jgi:hypothetical protein